MQITNLGSMGSAQPSVANRIQDPVTKNVVPHSEPRSSSDFEQSSSANLVLSKQAVGELQAKQQLASAISSSVQKEGMQHAGLAQYQQVADSGRQEEMNQLMGIDLFA